MSRKAAILVASLLVVSSIVGIAGVALAAMQTVQPQTSGTVTIAASDMQWEDPLKYENNNGEVVAHRGDVNTSKANPYTLTATNIELDDFEAFPHSSNKSAMNASRWTTSGANASKLSVSNSSTAPGIDSVNISTDGTMASGDVAKATFSDFSITTDQNKKYLIVGMDVHTLDAGTVVEVRAVDGDGDYKAAEVNSSRSSGEDLIANATAEGYIFQRQLGDMSTTTAGDGTFDGIEKVVVVVQDGDFHADVYPLNLDKMSKYQFGQQAYDGSDDDSEKDQTRTFYEFNASNPGTYSIKSRDTLGPAFDSAVIHDLEVDFVQERRDVPLSDIEVEFNETDNRPGYHGTATIYVPVGLESAYDVSYTNLETTETQPYLESRYIEVAYAEGVGSVDTPSEDISDSEWTDITSSYTGEGTEVTIDGTVQPGQTSYVKYRLQLQEDEFKHAQDVLTGGSGGAAKGPDRSGGLGSLPIVGGIIALVGGLVAWAKGWIPFMG